MERMDRLYGQGEITGVIVCGSAVSVVWEEGEGAEAAYAVYVPDGGVLHSAGVCRGPHAVSDKIL